MKKLRFLVLIVSIFVIHMSMAQVTETKLIPGDPENVKSFGFSVAMHGDVLIVGGADDNYLGPKTGNAVVLHYSEGEWIEDSVLIPDDWMEGARFGWSVDAQDEYVFISAVRDPANGLDAGAVYVYRYDPLNEIWHQHQKLVSSDIELGDEFGGSVSVSGDRLLIGASGDNNNVGAAYIFRKVGSDWIEDAKLIPLDYAGTDPHFGLSVCLDGDYAIIGAPMDASFENNAGVAYVFHFDGSNWVQQQKLVSSDIGSSDYFGLPVSLSGDYAMAGAVNATNQTVRSGAVYVFKRSGDQWTEQQKLFDSEATASIAFGKAVSVQDNYLVVGAPNDNQLVNNAGSLFVYENDGSNWVQVANIFASDAQESDKLGWSVDMCQGKAIAGAVLQDAGGYNCGAVYIYEGFVSAIPKSPEPLNFSLYPVPAQDIVHCRLSTVNCQLCYIELYDLYGRVVKVFNPQPATCNPLLDISHFPPGVYFVRIQAGDRIGVRKLVKQ